MSEGPQTSVSDVDYVQVLVEGLRKGLDSGGHGDESNDEKTYTEQISLPKNAPLSALWEKLKDLKYELPEKVVSGDSTFRNTDTKPVTHPFDEIEVVEEGPSQDGRCININDPLIAFANRQIRKEVKLNISDNVSSDYGTPMDCLKDYGGLEISFHRTIRMPDDDKLHQLPGSLGTFPLFNVNAYSDRLPDNMVEQGGVFLPMWQREALWINFSAPHRKNYALRVSVGRVNAVSGLSMDERTDKIGGRERLQDYVVVPGQEWLDGICVAPGIVRQFVAMPLGSGYTVEGQKTGQEKHGGLQIEIIPSYQKNLRVWLREPSERTEQGTASASINWWSNALNEDKTPLELMLNPGVKIRCYPANPTYLVPYEISDILGNALEATTSVKALYLDMESVVYTPRERISDQLPIFKRSGCPTVDPFELPAGCGDDTDLESMDEEDGEDLLCEENGEDECGIEYVEASGSTSSVFSDLVSTDRVEPNSRKESKSDLGNKVITKDLKAMGLAAGGKLVQDIYRDPHPARIWNTEAARIVHVHILDPASCERVTHIVPPPPPIDAMGYAEANMPFFVVEEQVDNRLDGGDFDNVISVSAMDKEKVVTTEQSFDPSRPRSCGQCETRLCDCIVRPCGHQFCNTCIKALEGGSEVGTMQASRQWKCPTCGVSISHVAGFSAPMNLPGEEALKIRVPVHVLKIEDGRVQFKSIQETRI